MTTHNQKPQSGYQAHVFFALLTAACIAFVLWAMIGKLDIVSRANGKVVPSGTYLVHSSDGGNVVARKFTLVR